MQQQGSSEIPVLVIDDEQDHRESICDVLRDAGFAVREARDGNEALNILTSTRLSPALILLDLKMPRMNGWEFFAILRSYTRFKDIPVVVISGNPPSSASLARAVVAAWVQKPVDVSRLLTIAQRHASSRPRPTSPSHG